MPGPGTGTGLITDDDPGLGDAAHWQAARRGPAGRPASQLEPEPETLS